MERVSKAIASFYESDDVFCAAFSFRLVVVEQKELYAVDTVSLKDVFSTLKNNSEPSWTVDKVYKLPISSDADLPSGLYFLDGIVLREAWRLYLDTHYCF